LVNVAADICGLHAQLMSSAELSLWSRVSGISPDAVARALWEEKTLAKTWAMRGTLHLIPTDEYPMWQVGWSTYRHWLQGSWLRAFGVSRAEIEQMIDAVGEALKGRPLTRDELADRVGSITKSTRLGDKLLESWGAMLKPASFRGQLCFAPNKGKNVRFTSPKRWLKPGPEVDPEDALQEIARRYLGAYAGATREDFARWWGLRNPAEAGRLLAALGDEAMEIKIGGTRRWMLSADVPKALKLPASTSVRLLPAFDPYVIGAPRNEAAFVAKKFKDRVYRPQAWISPVVLVAGRMEGVWRHEKKGSRVDVLIEPFAKPSAALRRQVEVEANRLAKFLGGRLELSWQG
jgi:uncharacterized protein YcaQ